MSSVYLFTALVGGVLLVIQFILTIIGGDADVDAEIDVDLAESADASAGLGLISFRTIVAFLAFFGLGGLSAREAGWSPGWQFATAVGCGAFAFYAVAWLMMKLHQLRSSGTIHIENAVGKTGQVYLRVPGNMEGRGKVTVCLQGRSAEYLAVTKGVELKTSTPCRITGLQGNDTLIVAPIGETERSHA